MIDEALEQFFDSHLAAKLGADYKKFRGYIRDINERNKKLAAVIAEKETRIERVEKLCADLAGDVKELAVRIEKYEKPERQAAEAGTNAVIVKFNTWAANPAVPLPAAFSFITGDFRIRTKQQIIETQEETKWITNREGSKKYLFPNPNSFNQMTASSLLYKVIGSPKAKGQNKIRITKPCEMTNGGWVNLPGELWILP